MMLEDNLPEMLETLQVNILNKDDWLCVDAQKQSDTFTDLRGSKNIWYDSGSTDGIRRGFGKTF